MTPPLYENEASILLPIPLQERQPAAVLPPELWSHIFSFLLGPDFPWDFLHICKSFNVTAKPWAYYHIAFSTLKAFEMFFSVLEPSAKSRTRTRSAVALSSSGYSAPGRWIHLLDVTELPFEGVAMSQHVDTLLSKMFPVLPNLESLCLSPVLCFSRRAAGALAHTSIPHNLRSLTGVTISSFVNDLSRHEHLLDLFQVAQGLESLEIIGQGFDPLDLELDDDTPPVEVVDKFTSPLHLPNLHTLILISIPRSAIMMALLKGSLPKLTNLTLTPYNDIPYPSGLSSRFIEVYGSTLITLSLVSGKGWPYHFHPSPRDLLITCPLLQRLSLDQPLPTLQVIEKHTCLKILSIPRPTTESWGSFSKVLPFLPVLATIHIRDVKWLRKGMNNSAHVAGVQGEMWEWKRRLEAKSIRLVDAEWKEAEH